MLQLVYCEWVWHRVLQLVYCEWVWHRVLQLVYCEWVWHRVLQLVCTSDADHFLFQHYRFLIFFINIFNYLFLALLIYGFLLFYFSTIEYLLPLFLIQLKDEVRYLFWCLCVIIAIVTSNNWFVVSRSSPQHNFQPRICQQRCVWKLCILCFLRGFSVVILCLFISEGSLCLSQRVLCPSSLSVYLRGFFVLVLCLFISEGSLS